jgi:hypothetical protein
MSKVKRIILNIRGIKYDVPLNNLNRFPNSRLSDLKFKLDNLEYDVNELNNICDDVDLDKMEFYFNRDPFIFNSILNYCVNGKLHIDTNLCVILFSDELNYWRIDEDLISNCCEWSYNDKKDDVQNDIEAEKKLITKITHKESFNNFILPGLREKIWFVMEKPSSSIWAKVIYYLFLSNFNLKKALT